MVPLFGLYDSVALLIARVFLGAVLIAHGWPKIKNFNGTAGWMGSVGLKPRTLFVAVAILFEFVGGLMLVVGLLTQFVAALVVIEFVIIIGKVTFKKGLVGGYELDLVILALALVLCTVGGGEKSLDTLFRIRFFW